MQTPTILILIPCYNEEKNIKKMLPRIQYFAKSIQLRFQVQTHILVVNDGSTDRSALILDQFEFHNEISCLHHDINQGYGKTLITGFEFAITKKFDWVITFDMDLQHEPNYLITVSRKCLTVREDVDMISGSRYLAENLLWQKPWKDRFLVNCIISTVLEHYGIKVTDAFCGFKAIRTSCLKKIKLKETGYEMPLEFWIKFQKQGFNFVEIAVPLIYKTQSQCLPEGADKQKLLIAGKKRVIKYTKILEHYSKISVIRDKKYLAKVFESCYLELPDITPKMLKSIFKQINQEMKCFQKKSCIEIPVNT